MKMEKKSWKLYFANYNFLIAQDLLQAHQILLIILLKEFKYKYEHNNKTCQTCGIKYKDCECCLEYANFQDDLMECNYLCYNKHYLKYLLLEIKCHNWSFMKYIVSFSGLIMVFSKLNLAKYHFLHKKFVFTVTSIYFISCLQLSTET